MTVEKIRYFIEVARSSSITQAAKNLYVSQPNLSKQIAQMEAECGFALFSRNKHRLELTEAGEALYEQLQHIPDIIEAAFVRAKEISMNEELFPTHHNQILHLSAVTNLISVSIYLPILGISYI